MSNSIIMYKTSYNFIQYVYTFKYIFNFLQVILSLKMEKNLIIINNNLYCSILLI
jgi:hypothetical protein